MIKRAVLLFFSLSMALAAQADFYGGIGAGVSVNGGSVIQKKQVMDYKNSPIYTFAVGYKLSLPIWAVRGEVEYLHLRPTVKKGDDSKLDAAFLNAYADVPLIPIVDPYVGLGVGYARFDHTNTPVVQGMAGLEYELPIMPLTIGGEYRYLKVNEKGGKSDSTSHFHTNILMLKARYAF